MRVYNKQRESRGAKGAAFSVVELMLAIAIMGIIVYALFTVFNQTQKAMRASEIQGDVSEKGRAIMEMVSRELAQAQPTFSAVSTNGTWINEANLFAYGEYQHVQSEPERLDLPTRTNSLYSLFFLTQRSNIWSAIGYRVTNVVHGVGELVRYEVGYPAVNPNSLGDPLPRGNLLSLAFQADLNNPNPISSYHHISDGVTHFKLTAYDQNGRAFSWLLPGRHDTNRYLVRMEAPFEYPPSGSGLRPFSTNDATVVLGPAFPGTLSDETSVRFLSNALPAYVELELGMLEPEALRQFYTMIEDENPNATNFLARQIAKVHLFRQRIPIRTAAQ